MIAIMRAVIDQFVLNLSFCSFLDIQEMVPWEKKLNIDLRSLLNKSNSDSRTLHKCFKYKHKQSRHFRNLKLQPV